MKIVFCDPQRWEKSEFLKYADPVFDSLTNWIFEGKEKKLNFESEMWLDSGKTCLMPSAKIAF